MRTLSEPTRADFVTDSDFPIIGQWYLHRRFAEPVEVVHVDAVSGMIDVHDAPGRIHELRLSDWIAADPQAVPAPNNLFHDGTVSEEETLSVPLLKVAI